MKKIILAIHIIVNFILSNSITASNVGIVLSTRKKCPQKGILKENIEKCKKINPDISLQFQETLDLRARIKLNIHQNNNTKQYSGKISPERILKYSERVFKNKIIQEFNPSKVNRQEARIGFACKSEDFTHCRMLRKATEKFLRSLKFSSQQLNLMSFTWIPSFEKYFRGLKSKVMNDPYVKQLVEYLYKPGEGDDSLQPSQVYKKNFEKLNLEASPELKTAAELVMKQPILQQFVQNYTQYSDQTFFIVAARPHSPFDTFLSINYEFYTTDKIQTLEKAEELIHKELPQFFNFLEKYPVFEYFSQDLYSMLTNDSERKAVILLYRPKLHSDKNLKSEFLATLKELDRDYWNEEEQSLDNKKEQFLQDKLLFATVDIMKRVNRPLIKLLDYNFQKFPCIVLLNFDKVTSQLHFKRVEVQSLSHVLYPYGFRNTIKPLLRSFTQSKNLNSETISKLESLPFDYSTKFFKNNILEVFPEFRKSYEKVNSNENSVYKLFQCGSSCGSCLKGLIRLEKEYENSQRRLKLREFMVKVRAFGKLNAIVIPTVFRVWEASNDEFYIKKLNYSN